MEKLAVAMPAVPPLGQGGAAGDPGIPGGQPLPSAGDRLQGCLVVHVQGCHRPVCKACGLGHGSRGEPLR
eukprot:1406279-Alexandrium_andersonii.AAC.1